MTLYRNHFEVANWKLKRDFCKLQQLQAAYMRWTTRKGG